MQRRALRLGFGCHPCVHLAAGNGGVYTQREGVAPDVDAAHGARLRAAVAGHAVIPLLPAGAGEGSHKRAPRVLIRRGAASGQAYLLFCISASSYLRPLRLFRQSAQLPKGHTPKHEVGLGAGLR